jgi:hypothetical protein
MLSKRLSTMLLAGAAVTGLGTSVNAGLLVDVRAVTVNGAALPSGDSAKMVTAGISVGSTVGLRVFVDVTGSDATKFQALQSLSGSFLSGNATGNSQTKGNLALSAAGQIIPFNSSGNSVGQPTDLDTDGDLDIGSNTPTDPAGFWAIRAANLTGPHSTDSAGNPVFNPSFPPTSIPNGTEYTVVNNLRFVITSLGDLTTLNFRNRASTTGGLWVENANEVTTDNGDGTTATGYSGGTTFTDTSNILSGAPVQIGVGGSVPEPASLGLAALAGLGMLARRRK